MKKIAVLTTTRAEFGLLRPLIIRLMADDDFEPEVLVTGTHLSQAFGNTYKEIEAEGIPIKKKINCLSEDDTSYGMTVTMSRTMLEFAKYFEDNTPDLIIVLGDRYETMAVCIAAMNKGIPIAHIHGGELTEGAIDDAIRHSITKMSLLHFVSTDIYRNRVIQLGEQPDRVFNVGALAVENIINMEFTSKEDLEKMLDLSLGEAYGVVTFHPVTLGEEDSVSQLEELLKALDCFPDMSFIITKANADAGGRAINERLERYSNTHKNVAVAASLGAKNYLSAIKHSSVVIGNSSSGIIEAPCLNIPTVNIGDRQKGRIIPASVLCCEPEKEDIVKNIKYAMSDDFSAVVKQTKCIFGIGDTSERIADIIKQFLSAYKNTDLKKEFYDL